MKRILLTTALVFAMGVIQSSQGMFMRLQTEKVPISRLFNNLQSRLKTNANDFVTLYQLARLHAMAYSTNLSAINVTANNGKPVFASPGSDSGVPLEVEPTKDRAQALSHLTNSIAFYERSLAALRKIDVSPTNEIHWMIIPTQIGYGWVLDQAGRTNDALKAYRKALKAAWKQEVEGEFNFKKWLNDAADDIKAGKNPLRSRDRGYIGPGVCYSEEIIKYMLRLLDPKRDGSEIKELQARTTKLNGMGRAITPLVISLEAGLSLPQLIDSPATAQFDLDGSGHSQRWGWLTPKAALLVYDPEGTGRITSGLQLFGNVTFWMFWKDGYDALASLDDNGDGELHGDELRGLALWQDVNGNGISDPGEVCSVSDYGIRSISCRAEIGTDGVLTSPIGVVFDDGSTRPSFDWVATMPAQPLAR
jgi:hypothetical protein